MNIKAPTRNWQGYNNNAASNEQKITSSFEGTQTLFVG
jgi:hypothetical protein